MQRRLLTLSILTCCLTAALPAAHAQGEPLVIKFSHVVAPDAPKGKAAEFFKQRVHALTQGKVQVEVYPNSQLYRDKEEIEALQLGSVQMIAPSLSKLSALGVREFEVFDLPFLFDNLQEVHALANGPLGQSLLRKLETRGIVGLGYWDNGFKSFSANKPLLEPKDFQGLKMRIQSSKVLEAQMEALGARPSVMAFSEAVRALRAGLVDGTENPLSNFSTQKFGAVQKHLTLSEHGYLGYAVIVNKRFWESLPGPTRQALTQALKDSTEVANKEALQDAQLSLEQIEHSTTQVHRLTTSQRRALKEQLLKVHEQMKSRIGESTLNAAYKAAHFKPDQ